MGYTGNTASRTVYWMENGDPADPRAVRTGVSDPPVGSFTYGPDTVADFDARFDNVRIRNFVFPEPTAALGDESWPGAQLAFDGIPCRDLSVVDSTTLTCVTPPHPEGAVDVTVTNPDGTNHTLADGYTYAPIRAGYLPMVLR